MKLTKWTGLASLIAVTVLTVSCVTAEPSSDGAGEATEESTAEGADPIDVRTLRVAHIYDPGHPVEFCGIPAAQAELEGSSLAIASFPGGQLGSENEIIEQVLDGSLDFAFAGAAFLSQYDENVGVLSAPFAYRDTAHFNEVIQGPIADELFAGLRESSGLDVFGTWLFGTRQLTSNFPVTTSDDMAGVKLRVPDAPLYLLAAEILGGVGTPVAFAEVYVALQQGVVDASENPIPTINGQKFYEVQDYINLTGHMIEGVMMTSSDAVTATLSADEIALLRKAALAGAKATSACIEEQSEALLLEWEAEGVMIVNRDVDVAGFQSRAAEIIGNSDFPWLETYLAIQNN